MRFNNLDNNFHSPSELAVQAQAVLDADNYAEMSAFAADILGATGIKPVGTPKSEVKSALSIFIDKYLEDNVSIDDTDNDDAESTVESYPYPTEYISGNGAVIYCNGPDCYSDGIKEWTKAQFDGAVSLDLLTKVEAVKKTAIVKPREIKPKRYFVKVSMPTVSFDDMDQELDRDDMTLSELTEYLNRLGQDDARMALSELRFSLVSKGSRKSIASRSNGGGGRPYIAKTLDNLNKLSKSQQAFVIDMHNNEDGIAKTEKMANVYGFYAGESAQGKPITGLTRFNNWILAIKKKGWAIDGRDGVYTLDYPNLPEGWEVRLEADQAVPDRN